MLELMLDQERVAELDLGAGDDRYKRLWATKRRVRVGLVAFDPRTWRGAAAGLRHVALPRARPARSWPHLWRFEGCAAFGQEGGQPRLHVT
jgi:CelD/BcsL family acetyltransferase involved in cellulose biosynthesis